MVDVSRRAIPDDAIYMCRAEIPGLRMSSVFSIEISDARGKNVDLAGRRSIDDFQPDFRTGGAIREAA